MIYSTSPARRRADLKQVDRSIFYDVIAKHIKESMSDPSYLPIRDMTREGTSLNMSYTLRNLITSLCSSLRTDDRVLFTRLFSKYHLNISASIPDGYDEYGDMEYVVLPETIEPNDYSALTSFFEECSDKCCSDSDEYFSLDFGMFYIEDPDNANNVHYLYPLNGNFLESLVDIFTQRSSLNKEYLEDVDNYHMSYGVDSQSYDFGHYYNLAKESDLVLSHIGDIIREVILCNIDPDLTPDILDRDNVSYDATTSDISVNIHSMYPLNYASAPSSTRSVFSLMFINRASGLEFPSTTIFSGSCNNPVFRSSSKEYYNPTLIRTNFIKDGLTTEKNIYHVLNSPKASELYAALVDITINEVSYTKIICLTGSEIHNIPYIKYADDKMTLDFLTAEYPLEDFISSVELYENYDELAPAQISWSPDTANLFVSHPLCCYVPADFPEMFDSKKDLMTHSEFEKTELHNVIKGLASNAMTYANISDNYMPSLNTFIYLKNYSNNPSNFSRNWVEIIQEYARQSEETVSTRHLGHIKNTKEAVDNVEFSYRTYKPINLGHGVLVFTDNCDVESDTQINIPYPIRDSTTNKLSIAALTVQMYSHEKIMVVTSDLLMSDFMKDGSYATPLKSIRYTTSFTVKKYLKYFNDVGISNIGITCLSEENKPLEFYYPKHEHSRINVKECIDEQPVSTLNVLEYTYDVPFASCALTTEDLYVYKVPHFYIFLQMWNSFPHKVKIHAGGRKSVESTEHRLRTLYPTISHINQVKKLTGDLYRSIDDSYKWVVENLFVHKGNLTDAESHLYNIERQAKTAGITKVKFYTSVAVFETPPLYVKNTQINSTDTYSYLGRYLIMVSIKDLALNQIPSEYNIIPMDFRTMANAGLHMSAAGNQCMGNLASLLVEADSYESFFGLVIKSLKSYNVGDSWGVPVLNCYPMIHSSLLKKLLKGDTSSITDLDTALHVPLKGLNILDYDPYQIISEIDAKTEKTKKSPQQIKDMLCETIQDISVSDNPDDYESQERMVYNLMKEIRDKTLGNTIIELVDSNDRGYNLIKHTIHTYNQREFRDLLFHNTLVDLRDNLTIGDEEFPDTTEVYPEGRYTMEEFIRDTLEEAFVLSSDLEENVEKNLNMYKLLVNKVKLKIFSL